MTGDDRATGWTIPGKSAELTPNDRVSLNPTVSTVNGAR
jgi:hypothetical protein